MRNKRVIGILIVGVDYAYHTNTENSLQTDLLAIEPCPITPKQAFASIQNFAQALIDMNVKELNELAKILFDEYGIRPQSNHITLDLVFRLRPNEDYSLIFQRTEKRKNYVPKKLGRINSRPHGGFRMRRNQLY